MIIYLLFDFSRVLLFPKDDNYDGLLNNLYRKVLNEKGAFLDNFRFNEELLNFLKPLKDKYNLLVYTTDIIQTDPTAKAVLDPIRHHLRPPPRRIMDRLARDLIA